MSGTVKDAFPLKIDEILRGPNWKTQAGAGLRKSEDDPLVPGSRRGERPPCAQARSWAVPVDERFLRVCAVCRKVSG